MLTAVPAHVLEPLAPFGVVARPAPGRTALEALPAPTLSDLVARHRLVVLRGFDAPLGDELPAFAARLGELQAWDFGLVNELREHGSPVNYLYTCRPVPFHWDGAFASRVPGVICFHCLQAPARGGETLFCDAVALLERAPRERRELWGRVRITYTTARLAHYGGSFSSPMLGVHPGSGAPVLRFAEPVDDLNPVTLEIDGVGAEERAALLDDVRRRLHDPELCYRHSWRAGDVVLADNHALLHGRAGFDPGAPRHIRRVNVL